MGGQTQVLALEKQIETLKVQNDKNKNEAVKIMSEMKV
jgi:hypothetical protein